jgi:hypothetical protein
MGALDALHHRAADVDCLRYRVHWVASDDGGSMVSATMWGTTTPTVRRGYQVLDHSG